MTCIRLPMLSYHSKWGGGKVRGGKMRGTGAR